MDLIDQIIEWDKSLFTLLNQWGIEALDPFFLVISRVAIWIPLYVFFAYLLFRDFNMKNALFLLLGAVLCVVLTDQLSVHAFKNVFERLRPCWNPELESSIRLVKEYCGGQYGFVSSHASNTFGFAVFMGWTFQGKRSWVKPTLLIWAFLISYSRIYLGVHYPMDVLGGAILGSGIGLAVYNIISNRVLVRG